MIDGKHRYGMGLPIESPVGPSSRLPGSNMKYYFRRWKESDTDDNFFRWYVSFSGYAFRLSTKKMRTQA